METEHLQWELKRSACFYASSTVADHCFAFRNQCLMVFMLSLCIVAVHQSGESYKDINKQVDDYL